MKGEIYMHNKQKLAFTLAEVLITLGIIGVVAAITMPTLVQNHQKSAYIAGLKKAMSVSANMFKKIQADEEVTEMGLTSLFTEGVCGQNVYTITPGSGATPEEWGCEDGYGNPSAFLKIIPKYLKVIKTCQRAECNIKYFHVSSLDDSKLVSEGDSKLVNYNGYVGNENSNTIGFYTADGMIYYFAPGRTNTSGHSIPFIKLSVDTNANKGPNVEGRDLFHMYYCIENGGVKLIENEICDPNDGRYNSPLSYLIKNGWKMDY